MKKLLILALATTVALADNPANEPVKEGAQEVGQELSQAGKHLANAVAIPAKGVKNAVVDVLNSDAVEDIADVGGQLIEGPKEVAEGIKDAAVATYEGAKEITVQVVNSAPVQATKEVGAQVVNATKDAAVATGNAISTAGSKVATVAKQGAVAVKDGFKTVINSEVVLDIADGAQDVGGQLLEGPGEVYEALSDGTKAVGTKIAAIARAIKNEFI